METQVLSWRYAGMMVAVLALAACAQTAQVSQSQPPPQPLAASNPPPVPPGPAAVWYHVAFDSNGIVVNAEGQKVIADVTGYLQRNPDAIATIIGRTDTVGTANYNMRLSHQRADAVRDALVYQNKVAAERVETRWTGERRQGAVGSNEVASASERVVDIAVH
jgi:OmpA-OmpF porin, OOP family